MTKPPKSLRHHIKDININANDVIKSDIDKYKNHPLIQPLNITEVEFKKYGALIKRIIREEETCAANPNDCYLIGKQHLRLIRDSNNKLTPIFIPCEKTAQLTNIKEHYLIHSFGTDYFKVRIAKAFFNKVDKTKADLLNLYKRYIDKKSIEHGIYLYGDMGIGKTYTSIALANEMANLGFKIAFVFLPDIIYELKQGFSHENNNNDEIMHKMMMADILFLDDFGAERSSA
jgi:DNA replication protein DnaC